MTTKLSKEYKTKVADLDDWPAIKELKNYLGQDEKAQKWVYGSEEELRGYFLNSLVNPYNIAILMLYYDTVETVGESQSVIHTEPIGMATIMLHNSPVLTQPGVGNFTTVFCHSVFIRDGFGYNAGITLFKAGEQWGRERGAKAVFGNQDPSRGDFEGYARKYGVKAVHIVTMKEIDPDG